VVRDSMRHAAVKGVCMGACCTSPNAPQQSCALLLLLVLARCRYRTSVEEVPVGEYTLPLGQAAVVREGSDITLVGWGAQVRVWRTPTGWAACSCLATGA
jgi:hypothetical protein